MLRNIGLKSPIWTYPTSIWGLIWEDRVRISPRSLLPEN